MEEGECEEEDGDGRGVTLEDGVLDACNPQACSMASSHGVRLRLDYRRPTWNVSMCFSSGAGRGIHPTGIAWTVVGDNRARQFKPITGRPTSPSPS